MTTRAERIAAEAEEAVGSWPSLSPEDRAALTRSGVISKLESGGYLIDVGDAYPIWRPDMGAVRRLLLERDLAAADASTVRA